MSKKGRSLPEFFFVISPEGFLYGCGYYSASTASMESLRKLILAGDRAFQAALSAYENQDTFQLDGDLYKRSRYPGQPEHLRDWLDRKTICFLCSSDDFDLLYSEELARVLAEGYQTLAPVYRLLIKAENLSST